MTEIHDIDSNSLKINYTDLSSVEPPNKTIEGIENNFSNLIDINDLSTNVEFYKKYKDIENKLEIMKVKMSKNNVLKAKDIETVIQSRRITLIELLKYKYLNRKTILKHLKDNKPILNNEKDNKLNVKFSLNTESKSKSLKKRKHRNVEKNIKGNILNKKLANAVYRFESLEGVEKN
jgi:hypothetical protein